MQIEYKKVDELIPYINNPKEHDEEQVNLIASSIKNFGFINPIIIDKDNEIIAGHGRLLAAKKLKLDKVPTIKVENLTDAQVKAYRIADNRLTELGDWDSEILKVELETLKDEDFDLDLTGFSDLDLENILEENKETKDISDEDNIYTDKIEPIVYTPERENPPSLNKMYNTDKVKVLLEKIEKSNIKDKELKDFLKFAAYRFTEFSFKNIAEYYAHADKEVQELFEDLALVIIDIEKAIQKGFVKAELEINKVREQEVKELYDEEY